MKIVFIGCNISNLVIATVLSIFSKKYKIYILERDKYIGGNFKSFNFKSLKFDYGMRVLYSSTNKFLDRFYKNTFKEKFNFLKNPKKDLAGIILENEINIKTPYLNFQNSNAYEKKKIEKQFQKSLKNKSHKSLNDFLLNKYGMYLTKKYYYKFYKNIFKVSPKKLDTVAGKIIQSNRLVLYKDSYNLKKYKNKKFRNFFGFSDQRLVPKKYLKKQFGIYPKCGGIYTLTKKLKSVFLKNEGKLILNANLVNLKIEKNKIKSLEYIHKSNVKNLKNIKYLIYSGSIFQLFNILKIKLQKIVLPKKQDYYYIYCKLDNTNFFRDVYYLYDHTNSNFLRLTNYYNYCLNNKYRNIICIEFLPEKHLNNQDIKREVRKYFLEQKYKFKVRKIIFLKIIKSFREPLPTLQNADYLSKINKIIKSQNLINLVVNLPTILNKCFYMFEQVDYIYKFFKNKKVI